MHILRRPHQYTLLACLVLLAVPIFWLNLWVLHKGAVLTFLKAGRIWWLVAQASWVVVTLYWLFQVRWRGFWSFLALASTMLLANVYYLVVTKNYALAFYALFVLILGALYAAHLYRNLRESYYDSGQRWYEGEPRFLPRVEASMFLGDGETTSMTPVRLSRLGVEGCYVFSSTNIDKVDQLKLKLGDLELNCAVELVSKSKTGEGGGLRFVRASADQDKDIRDFIDRVRSAGYVS